MQGDGATGQVGGSRDWIEYQVPEPQLKATRSRAHTQASQALGRALSLWSPSLVTLFLLLFAFPRVSYFLPFLEAKGHPVPSCSGHSAPFQPQVKFFTG